MVRASHPIGSTRYGHLFMLVLPVPNAHGLTTHTPNGVLRNRVKKCPLGRASWHAPPATRKISGKPVAAVPTVHR